MSQEKSQRPEPVLQPMRIVNVEGPAPVLGMPSGGVKDPNIAGAPAVTPSNPTGKKLVMSKKELEAAKRAESKTVKPNVNIPYIFPGPETVTIGSPERNSRVVRTLEQAPEYDLEWLKSVGGKHAVIAWLQTSISISGFVSSEATFSSQKIRGLTMSWQGSNSDYGQGLLYQIKNSTGVLEDFIPSANIKDVGFKR